MRRVRVAGPGLAVGVLLVLWGMGAVYDPGSRSKAGGQHTYESHYLVFGTRDDSGTSRLLALDLNRTVHGPHRVAYEYKLFVAHGGDWSMPVYETWQVDPSQSPRFPSQGGLAPSLSKEGVLQRVRADLPDRSLVIRPKNPTFPFPKNRRAAASRTDHPEFAVQWNGTTYEGPGVYEWIQSGPSLSRTSPEEKRQLDSAATFGLYDWMVLYDEKGRLWQISQGTLTPDFAYQQATEQLPAETHDVHVQWVATQYDAKAEMHSPTQWLVDVPAWGFRVRLRKKGSIEATGPSKRTAPVRSTFKPPPWEEDS